MIPRKFLQCTTLLLLAAGISGCSSTEPGDYDGIRQGQINECNQMPSAQRARCLARITGEYEEHRRQQEMIEDQ